MSVAKLAERREIGRPPGGPRTRTRRGMMHGQMQELLAVLRRDENARDPLILRRQQRVQIEAAVQTLAWALSGHFRSPLARYARDPSASRGE